MQFLAQTTLSPIALIIETLIKFQLGIFLEHHQMARSSKCKISNQISFLDFVVHIHLGNAAADFSHPNEHDCNIANFSIICLHHHNHSGGNCRQKCLAFSALVIVMTQKLGLVQVICPWNWIDINHCCINGSVPTVVGRSAEIRLIDCAILKKGTVSLFKFVLAKHIDQGVTVILQPKQIGELDVSYWLNRQDNRSRLTAVNYNILFRNVWGSSESYLSDSWFKLP